MDGTFIGYELEVRWGMNGILMVHLSDIDGLKYIILYIYIYIIYITYIIYMFRISMGY